MKKIGLMSDTHGFVDPKVYDYFKDVDEIWHAGDIGDIKVLDDLKAFKPLRAVWGNIDNTEIRSETEEFATFECEKVKVLITHIAGKPGKYYPKAKERIDIDQPDLFICGHSHICLVKMDPNYKMLWMNPGACGFKGFHQVKTLLRFKITGDQIHDLEVIEMGKRA